MVATRESFAAIDAPAGRSVSRTLRLVAATSLVVYLAALLLGPDGTTLWRELVLQVLTLALITGYAWVQVAAARDGRGWRIGMAGWLTFFTLGNVVGNAHTGPTVPDWANTYATELYVSCYPFAIIGVLVMHRGRWRPRDPGALLDALISTLAIAAVFTAFILPRALVAARDGGIPLALVLAFPVCDLTVLGLIAAATSMSGDGPGRLSGWLILAVALFGTADWTYAVGAAQGTWHTGTPMDGVWVVACAVIGLLACQPGRAPQQSRLSRQQERVWATASVAVPLASACAAVMMLAVGTRMYLPLPGVGLAVTAITMALLRLVRAYTQVRALAEFSLMARTDELTGLLNRRALHERMTVVLASRPHEPFAVLLTDLDGFKEVNDRLGHAAGDELLRLVADRLRATMPDGGVLARLGGDEFAAMLPGLGQAPLVSAAMVAAIAHPAMVGGHRLSVSMSLGLTYADSSELVSHGELLRRADVAMYAAKRAGGSRVHEYRPGEDQVLSPAATTERRALRPHLHSPAQSGARPQV
jgi:diguanylate cyclase (GGDEF)-like protein